MIGKKYGSMQVHVADLSTTVFAFNRWNYKNDSPDIGIGNAESKNTDWTLSQTGKLYVIKRLEVFVKSAAPSLLVEASDRVKEASMYELAYKLDVPDKTDFMQSVPYSPIDALPDELDITRIAYYMQLINEKNVIQWVWVSMDAFTEDILKIGVPTVGSKAIFQQDVLNLNIKSSLADINDYKGSGNIEFWPTNYGGNNIKKVKGATAIYDWGDERSGG